MYSLISNFRKLLFKIYGAVKILWQNNSPLLMINLLNVWIVWEKKIEKCAPENEFENLFECLVIITKILNEILSSRYFASLLVISTNWKCVFFIFLIIFSFLFFFSVFFYHLYLADRICFIVKLFVFIFIVFPNCFCVYLHTFVHSHRNSHPYFFVYLFLCLFVFSSVSVVFTFNELCQQNVCVNFLFWRKG